MSIVNALLQAIIRLDGEAIVMHVGDRPYVVTPAGQVDLATRGLTLESVTGIVNQLLPGNSQHALDELGVTQYELPAMPDFPGESFTVVAARGGDDVWAEIRRRRVVAVDDALLEFSEQPAEPAERPAAAPPLSDDLAVPRAEQFWPPRGAEPSPPTASVLPLSRSPIRPDVPPTVERAPSSLDEWLRLAAARGAAVLYLSSSARPSMRVDGEILSLEGAPVLAANDVESLLLALMPERHAESLRAGAASEWMYELPGVGRVRCLGFRDHSGPGGVFRILPARPASADQLGLTREMQALTSEPGGLVLVAGPRASGKRTLLAAFIDRVNRTRRDHVISIESEINVEHERSASLVSQREVRGGVDDMLAAARSALREDPDVLVLETVRSAAMMNVALEAAASGQLVIAAFPAGDATGAIDRIIDLYPPDSRRQVQVALAQDLRGVLAQVLPRKRGGGRVAARELLLHTPAVAAALADGRTSQLSLAIEGGRKAGMISLNDSLVGYVQSGVVDVQEAYRCSANRAGFLALMKKLGLDTAAVERLA